MEVTPIYHKTLRHVSMFNRPWRIDEEGQYWDDVDGKPFSTEFSHSRFLVPELARRNNLTGGVLFCASDFLFLSDVCEVFEYCNDDYAVMCVKHNYNPEEGIKMDGMLQQNYNKKLWSSFVLYNLDHPVNDRLDEVMVNSETGSNLHTSAGWTMMNRLAAYLTVGILFPVLAMALMMFTLCTLVLAVLGLTVTKIVNMLKSGKQSLTTMNLA